MPEYCKLISKYTYKHNTYKSHADSLLSWGYFSGIFSTHFIEEQKTIDGNIFFMSYLLRCDSHNMKFGFEKRTIQILVF